MITILFGVFQFLILIVLTPYALGVFLKVFEITDIRIAVAFLTFWIYGIVIGYGSYFHVWSIQRMYSNDRKV